MQQSSVQNTLDIYVSLVMGEPVNSPFLKQALSHAMGLANREAELLKELGIKYARDQLHRTFEECVVKPAKDLRIHAEELLEAPRPQNKLALTILKSKLLSLESFGNPYKQSHQLIEMIKSNFNALKDLLSELYADPNARPSVDDAIAETESFAKVNNISLVPSAEPKQKLIEAYNSMAPEHINNFGIINRAKKQNRLEELFSRILVAKYTDNQIHAQNPKLSRGHHNAIQEARESFTAYKNNNPTDFSEVQNSIFSNPLSLAPAMLRTGGVNNTDVDPDIATYNPGITVR